MNLHARQISKIEIGLKWIIWRSVHVGRFSGRDGVFMAGFFPTPLKLDSAQRLRWADAAAVLASAWLISGCSSFAALRSLGHLVLRGYKSIQLKGYFTAYTGSGFNIFKMIMLIFFYKRHCNQILCFVILGSRLHWPELTFCLAAYWQHDIPLHSVLDLYALQKLGFSLFRDMKVKPSLALNPYVMYVQFFLRYFPVHHFPCTNVSFLPLEWLGLYIISIGPDSFAT